MIYSPHMAAKKATLDNILSTLERGFAAVASDITDIKSTMATKADISRLDRKIENVESNLGAKVDRLDTKLTKFEESEIDKRKQLEVRVTAIEKHLGLDKKIAA